MIDTTEIRIGERYEGEKFTEGKFCRHCSAQEISAQMLGYASAHPHHDPAHVSPRSSGQAGIRGHRAFPQGHRENSTALESIEIQRSARPAPLRPSPTSDPCTATLDHSDSRDLTAEIQICFYRLDTGSTLRTSFSENGHSHQPPAPCPNSARGRIQLRPAGPYSQGQAQGAPASTLEKEAKIPKKGALRAYPHFRLCFGDESGFNLFPYLTRLWQRKGKQTKVPTPGKNRKQYVFGAVDYKSGKFFWHVQETNNQWGCLVVVQQLVAWAKSIRTPVLLVWDNSRTHTAKKLEAHLTKPHVRRWLKIFWLSTYSPDLNDIERLWRHLKRTGVANHLFKSPDDFRAHLLTVLSSVNQHPHTITGILFKLSKVS